jgi:uncharacterized protein (TIGR00255 family)
MFYSMTGFGSASKVFKGSRGEIEITAEIKTVNSKYLDISPRSPRAYVSFDADIARWVRMHLKRGRVDISLSMRILEGIAEEIKVNIEQVKVLSTAFEEVRNKLNLESPITLNDLLKFPDWIASKEVQVNKEEEWEFVKKVLELAMKQVLSSREKEGKALEEIIESQRDKFGEILEKIARMHESLLKNLRERTKDRVKNLHGMDGFDPHRLEQEVVLWISRADFQEELDRIRHHLETFDKLTESDGEVGRKLEFLVQELHREVNTLGSKCPDASVTPLIIELKSCIERIREQIQNIE